MARRGLAFLRRSARNWGPMRAAARQWPLWIVRQLAMPIAALPLTVTTRRGTRVRLGADRVDDLVLLSVAVRSSALYFPDPPGHDHDGVILDLGAHSGIYAVDALRRYPRCRLIAVEPDPRTCARLAENVRLNAMEHRVRIVNGALADRPGLGRLVEDESGSWGTRVQSDGGRGGDVRLMTLAEILAGETPSVVKCNAEGAEFALVPQLIERGMRPRSIVLMVHPAFGSPEALVRQLESAGYVVRDADSPPKRHRFHAAWPARA